MLRPPRLLCKDPLAQQDPSEVTSQSLKLILPTLFLHIRFLYPHLALQIPLCQCRINLQVPLLHLARAVTKGSTPLSLTDRKSHTLAPGQPVVGNSSGVDG